MMTTLAAPPTAPPTKIVHPSPPPEQVHAAAIMPRRFTREEYYRMADVGFFQDQHVERIDGVILRMSPQSEDHVHAVSGVFMALHRAFGPGYLIRNQANLRVGNSDPEPDFAVVPRSIPLAELRPADILLVVEVSVTSLAYDRGAKASLYASAGIGDYWIVNLINKCLEIRREPAPDAAAPFGHGYGRLITLSPADHASPLAMPNAAIAVADLFN